MDESYKKPKRQLYDNCKLFDPDGKFLSFISKNKLDWYVSKGIVTSISDTEIKLTFYPKGGKKGTPFMDEERPKDNVCVVCGEDDINELRRARIIDVNFKKVFPESIKSYKCDDVIIVCNEDAADVDSCCGQFAKQIFKIYNVNPKDFDEDKLFKQIKILVTNIIKSKGFVTEHTKKKINEYFGYDPTLEQMQEWIKSIQPKVVDGCTSPEELVVKKVIESKQVKEFFNLWKKNFVECMEPDCLQWDFFVDYEDDANVDEIVTS